MGVSSGPGPGHGLWSSCVVKKGLYMANTKVIDGENQGNPGEKRKNYKPLTLKQEKFCECLVMGMSQVEAYKTAMIQRPLTLARWKLLPKVSRRTLELP